MKLRIRKKGRKACGHCHVPFGQGTVEVQPSRCQWCHERYVARIFNRHGKCCDCCLYFVNSVAFGGRGFCIRTPKPKKKKVNMLCAKWARWTFTGKVDQRC